MAVATNPPTTQYNEAPLNELLCQAAAEGDVAAIKMALEMGADKNYRKGDGLASVLMAAISGKHYEAVEFLLEAGADPNLPNKRGFTPIFFATTDSFMDPLMLDLLLDYGADPDIRNFTADYQTQDKAPLHEGAAKQKHSAIVAMLKAGANPFVKDKNDQTPREVFAMEGGEGLSQLEFYEALPYCEPSAIKSKADLFTADEKTGYCLLDNPRMWRAWDEVSARLSALGESLSKEELLAPSKADGESYLLRAADARVMAAVVEGLNAQGETLRLNDLKQAGVLEETHAGLRILTKAVSTYENLGENPKQAVRSDIAVIPPELLGDIFPNRHSLLATLDRESRLSGRGGLVV